MMQFTIAYFLSFYQAVATDILHGFVTRLENSDPEEQSAQTDESQGKQTTTLLCIVLHFLFLL